MVEGPELEHGHQGAVIYVFLLLVLWVDGAVECPLLHRGGVLCPFVVRISLVAVAESAIDGHLCIGVWKRLEGVSVVEY